ncbi:Transposase IS66 family protein [Planctomyces sp. SH-PL62]|nr:Transposase IS66 family protein [Planctomyces sp. SH-PL62]
MNRPGCIPQATWDVTPPEAQAVLAVAIAAFEVQIADLKASLKQDSSDSSRPPSSDPPHLKPAPPRKPSGRRRGGQPGRRRNDRIRLEADEVVDARPDRCRRCGEALAGDDPAPLARQVCEVPAVRPHVVEHRLHGLTCPRCGASTCGAPPDRAGVGYGPQTQAVCAALAGENRLSKRRVARAMKGLYGLPIGPTSVFELERRTAEAPAPIHAEVLEHIRGLDANVDETSWPQGRERGWLWTAATTRLAAFLVAASRSCDAFAELMGRSPPGVVTSDRYSAYAHLAAERRQACRAHPIRDFRAMVDHDDAGSAIGEELLMHSGVLFDAWSKVRVGESSRPAFAAETLPWLRREVRDLLEAGVKWDAEKTAASCREALKIEPSLWTFATVEGVEPTNNDAERGLRQAVCWRKTSFGADSEGGSRFAAAGSLNGSSPPSNPAAANPATCSTSSLKRSKPTAQAAAHPRSSPPGRERLPPEMPSAPTR